MDKSKFRFYNYIAAAVVTVISAVTYMLTLESGASFWDCGEFIASSYKLEVGHPPGNPVFQLFARLFTMPFSGRDVAIAVNALSGLCSALTIYFLYMTIVFFVRRIVKPASDGSYTPVQAAVILGSGIVGSLAYAFSDTFWFSAVEGEVYAMSSFFTAIVFWAMTRWYDEADSPHANRWIILISLLMGLSIGVHLLNLLTIPALVFMFFYRKRESSPYSFWQVVGIFLIGVVILGILNFLVIPYLPKIAAYFDLFFVNVLGLPINSGAIFFVLLVFAICFWGLFSTMKKGKVFINTVLLCLTSIMIGFSIFSVCVIRSNAKTPTNEYQPDNPFTLVRYLSREQYGKTPLLYGPYYGCPLNDKNPYTPTKYWTPMNGKYIQADGVPVYNYSEEGKMLFPRMWSNSPSHIDFYEYTRHGKNEKNAKYTKPSFSDNLGFFLDYQMHFMYWRYFMWNFAGRQNEYHSDAPGDRFRGNWECGIPLIDELRLGDQSNAPSYLKDNKGKNHYFLLPLLLGLIGLCFHCGKDIRGCWLNFLMFFMTGIAIVIYLNQPPYQVRERDYAYAGSFYFFAVWIGIAVCAVNEVVSSFTGKLKEKFRTAIAVGTGILCLGVPVLMAQQNWDDHDRSGRNTAVESAYNYLNSVGRNGILVTHGDNDTFPLWYAQEVEGIRPDVRVCNTSLLGTDWYIDQMKYACNESAPLKLSVEPEKYLYGTNDYVQVFEIFDTPMLLSDVMDMFRHPNKLWRLTDAYFTPENFPDVSRVKLNNYKSELKKMGSFICANRILVPVNRENLFKFGILDADWVKEKGIDIPDFIELTIGGDYISKPDLFMLDLLSTYEWDRPINMLGMGGDISVGIKEYLMYEGFSYKFVPFKTGCKHSDPGIANADELYRLMTETLKWDEVADRHHFVDYQNLYTFCGVMGYRNLFAMVAGLLTEEGKPDKAIEILDKCQEVMNESQYPIEMTYLSLGNESGVLEMLQQYYAAEEMLNKEAGTVNFDKSSKLMERYMGALSESFEYFCNNPREDTKRTFQQLAYQIDACCSIVGWYEGEDAVVAMMDKIPDGRARRVLEEMLESEDEQS